MLPALCLLLGCSGRLAPVKPPQIDIEAAANGALERFDRDGNSSISKDEADACQGLLDHWDRYDHDADGSVSAAELSRRFSEWTTGDTGLMNLRAEVTYRGRPLPDAQVTLTPFDFLGPNLLRAKGTTDRYGFAFLAIPKDQLPESQRTTHGMQVGLYQISVTHPRIDLPEEYHTKTTLSADLSPAEANTGIRLQLK